MLVAVLVWNEKKTWPSYLLCCCMSNPLLHVVIVFMKHRVELKSTCLNIYFSKKGTLIKRADVRTPVGSTTALHVDDIGDIIFVDGPE